LTAPALERLRGRLSAEPTANVALIRETLRAVLAEQRAARETEALKLALLGLAIDTDLVFDLHCDGEALLHLYASGRQRTMRWNWRGTGRGGDSAGGRTGRQPV